MKLFWDCKTTISSQAGGGDDIVKGNDGDDKILGYAGDDVLQGDSGDDKIDGGGRNDVLIGGDGDDILRRR